MKYKIIQLLLLSQLTLFANITAQNIAINSTGSSPNAAAILDLTNGTTSNFLGLLVPRFSALPTSKLSAIAQGLLFYNSNNNLFYVNTNSLSTTPNWVSISNNLIITGNTLVSSGTTSITSTVTASSTSYASTVSLTDALPVWSVNGNAITTASDGTSPANNSFLGTLNSQDLLLKTNNLERMRIANATGNVGIGTVLPISTLDVNGTFGSNLVYLTYNNNTAASFTVGTTSSNVYYTSSGQGLSSKATIYLPTVVNCGCYNRRFIITNAYTNTFTFIDPSNLTNASYYISLSNTSINTINGNSSIEIIADPLTKNWLQIR